VLRCKIRIAVRIGIQLSKIVLTFDSISYFLFYFKILKTIRYLDWLVIHLNSCCL